MFVQKTSRNLAPVTEHHISMAIRRAQDHLWWLCVTPCDHLGGVALDEGKRLDSIREAEDLIGSDSTTPLHLIREKELELSGRVLQARESAGEITAAARKQAAEIISKAERDSEAEVKAYEEQRMKQANEEAEAIRGELGALVASMQEHVATSKGAAVDAVVARVTRI
jgi:vacuolar-type H+-ATPase subunit H